MTDINDIDREWFKKWFNCEYLQLYGHRDQSEADSFIDYLLESGWIRAGERVLDAGCGAGRHMKSILGKGADVFGIDLSADLLTESQRLHGGSLARRVVRGDVRYLPFKRVFDSVLSLFTGFGYFSEAENAALVKVFHSVLKPGGRILIDVFNPGRTIDELEKYSRKAIENRVIEEYRDYCSEENRINKRIVITKDGEMTEYYESVVCYSVKDFRDLFNKAGFKILRIIGDYKGWEYNDDSKRLIIMGEKIEIDTVQ
ncbi:MAG: class I SAM-dependent methyltransferase [FCB group bacterium]|nr:class I SAM-dependent methyltransferase [FCB group bacterium]